jgi:hypothetical protein
MDFMANMSYCAFENTSNDLQQLLNMMQEAQENGMNMDEFITSRSSKYESIAVMKVLSLCNKILQLSDDMDILNSVDEDV